MEVSDTLLETFKERMHIFHDSEDSNLKQLLSFSIADLQDKCGVFNVDEHDRARELVIERTRYAYNDAIEFFDENFQSQITSLGFSLYVAESGGSDEISV
ncbi:phage gp6-like head-tail connector protein [Listeria monocytogenes]|nr:phage gp6-like head-tail connector protein [Listeria monocytogenes]EJM6842190.1 phage gp6-like head-tail connector protein [Listeria monocytogenes]